MNGFKLFLVASGLAVSLVAPGQLQAATVVEQARDLATGGQGDEAIRLLRERLGEAPGDTDVRTMLGIVLSWEGRYDESRAELGAVVAENPAHGDALPALINVEMWSGNPARAEELARRGLESRPDDPAILTDHARALDALGRREEARRDVERALARDPRNRGARRLKEKFRGGIYPWQAGLFYTYDHFTPGGDDWHEFQASLKRKTPIGSVIGRLSHARRFGIDDNLIEVEAYPGIRSGTYAWVNVGFSPNADLYPRYRFGADIYQSLPAGFEASLGYRRLGFDSPVNIYVGSLGKYYGSWLFTGRVFVTPGTAGQSRSYSLGARRFFGDRGGYYGFRYGWGRSPEIRSLNELETLSSRTIAAELVLPLPRRFELDVRTSWSQQDRINDTDLHQLSIAVGLFYSF